ncbi:type II toxin-antitoxin system ParD family antitoxin [Sphingomonas sp. MA1305]|uniref:type II toxin-antitoxin system ParD family antitoxin n=1 Tax=Sphingomonas sp. MA1305 TaxID=2479204 RepID=UPI0018E0439C|nr:type II toxin-antitoxin system ParD family antitoxin [Sphingomonas sp. MA1305]MBI0473941.1 type II toxin-antitoxin system ParD family antitoxin [Sphingomonas sp. MA1305]
MANRQSRNISLTSELDAFIDGALATGDYGNASEVVRTALKLLRDNESSVTRAVASDRWPIGDGECAHLIRERDWSRTHLGPIESWPEALRLTVSNIVNSPVPKVLMWGRDGLMLYNDGYIAVAGAHHPHALGATARTIWPEIWDWNSAILERGFAGEVISYRDQPMQLNRSGRLEQLYFDLFYTPIYLPDGSVGGVMCTVLDNTARIAMEAALSASEHELRTITDALPVLISYVDRDQIYRFANSYYEHWLGVPGAVTIGKHIRDVIGADLYAEREPLIARALAGEPIVSEGPMPHRDGTPRRAEIRYLPRLEADGSVAGFHILVADIEERAQREAEVRASNDRFRAAMEAVHGVLWTNTADGRMEGEQPGWQALTGQTAEQYRGYGWAQAVHPDDAQPTVVAWEAAVAAQTMFVFEHRVRRHDGAWRNCLIRALPIKDGQRIVEWVGVHTDITEQRAAEQSLRDQADALARQVRHRERAEEQLRQLNENLEARVIAEIGERRAAEAALAQAQKMETIGKLTGGVAHDFNNLLQVVSGNLQLLAKDIVGNERAERRVANAMAGVSRGSKLAAQLLAFGRRQALEPKVVNVTRFVQGMDDLLRRAIGEAIEIETVFGGGLWNCFIDPVQIENALLNLAINARDAMNGQGKLTIELANAHLDDAYARTHDEVEPGQYVMLAVSDTGSGMAPEIIEKVFEPFFSTKSEGKGSGLGLSMVYGFVKQSGGHVKIYSEVGEGTTIKLYLPRSVEAEDVEVVTATGPIVGGTETVLVVEDDDEVRATVVEMLGDLGYRVLKAVDAQSALSVIESGIPIDLLFTDVVMPGRLKSPELARKAKERLPELAVLFTSGYTENSIVHGGRLDAGVELLSKPYTREALARKFRHVLANQRQRREGLEARALTSAPAPLRPAPGANGQVTVLLVEDDEVIRATTAELLQQGGYVVVDAASAEEAMTALQTVPIDVLVTDVNLPGLSGPSFARTARELRPRVGVVFATGDVAAVPADTGAVLLAKPYGLETLHAAISGAIGRPVSAAPVDAAKLEREAE